MQKNKHYKPFHFLQTPPVKLVIFALFGASLSVRAAEMQPGQVLSFRQCEEQEHIQFQHLTNCWIAQGEGNSLWVADSDNFNCGTAGCIVNLYRQNNDKLENLKTTMAVQCEQQENKTYKCFSYTETYEFAPIDKNQLQETYQQPYLSYLGENNYLILDMTENCSTPEGCAVFNYTLENGRFIRGYPFVRVVCRRPSGHKKAICETRSKYLDSH